MDLYQVHGIPTLGAHFRTPFATLESDGLKMTGATSRGRWMEGSTSETTRVGVSPQASSVALGTRWMIRDAFFCSLLEASCLQWSIFTYSCQARHNPEPRSEVWWWNLRWSFGGTCFWRFSPAKEARKSPSKLRRKFATNFAENFANFTLEVAGAYLSWQF